MMHIVYENSRKLGLILHKIESWECFLNLHLRLLGKEHCFLENHAMSCSCLTTRINIACADSYCFSKKTNSMFPIPLKLELQLKSLYNSITCELV
jgi:hypothetical protein